MKNFPKKFNYGDIVLVEWYDAYTSAHGWTAQKDLLEATACLCFSVGRYIGKNKAGDVLLAGSWDMDTTPTCNNVSGRPIQMIQKVTLLRKGKKS